MRHAAGDWMGSGALVVSDARAGEWQPRVIDIRFAGLGEADNLEGTLALGGGTIDTTPLAANPQNTENLFQNLHFDGGTIDPGTVINGGGNSLSFSSSSANT
jgi:hypothetical protein